MQTDRCRPLSQLLTLMFTTKDFGGRPNIALVDNSRYGGLCELADELCRRGSYSAEEAHLVMAFIRLHVRARQLFIQEHLFESGSIVGSWGLTARCWTAYRRAWLSEEIERLEACGK